jgi:hypothetical protein
MDKLEALMNKWERKSTKEDPAKKPTLKLVKRKTQTGKQE